MTDTKIEWATKTWNPIVGCSIKSAGCTNCYAMKMAWRLEKMGVKKYAGLTEQSKAGPVWNGKLAFDEKALLEPLKWKKPQRIFVNSMGDLFHENAEQHLIDRVISVAAFCPHHTFLILTKRPKKQKDYFCALASRVRGGDFSLPSIVEGDKHSSADAVYDAALRRVSDGLNNVWLGVSVEDQKTADERIPVLLDTPAAIRFISAEPLLGPIDLERISHENGNPDHYYAALSGYSIDPWQCEQNKIDWVIVGGESGPGARPMQPEWARDIRDQCVAADVPFFFKQHGAWAPFQGEPPKGKFGNHLNGSPPPKTLYEENLFQVGKKRAGRLLDGKEWNQFPEVKNDRT